MAKRAPSLVFFPTLSSVVLNLCFILSTVALSTTLSMASSERGLPRKSATWTTAPLRSCLLEEYQIYAKHDSVIGVHTMVSKLSPCSQDTKLWLHQRRMYQKHRSTFSTLLRLRLLGKNVCTFTIRETGLLIWLHRRWVYRRTWHLAHTTFKTAPDYVFWENIDKEHYAEY